ncbi:MAG TPA: hypothetical protein VHJ20_20455, partial [Polyangia bacterium]|nr:hypothetical protein [Polyangia bacterium]
MGRGAAAALLGVAALAAAGGALVVGHGAGPAAAEAARAGDEIRAALAAATTASRHDLEAEATAAAAVPQLGNALAQKMDAFTLQDLFATEDWWAPHRARAVVVTTPAGVVVKRNGPAEGLDGPPTKELVAAVQAGDGKPASAIVRAGAAAFLAAAARVEDAAGYTVVLARPIDAHLLADWAEPSHLALTISDGHVALPTGGAPGPARAEALVGREAEVVVDDGGAWLAAAAPL